MGNALLPLGVNMPDFAGAYAQGQQVYQGRQEMEQKNALRAALQEFGPAAMQGDQNALAELSKYDPELGMGLMGKQQDMQLSRNADARADKGLAMDSERLELARQQARQQTEQHVFQMAAADREAAQIEIDEALAAATQVQDEAGWDALMSQKPETKDFVGQFGQKDMLIASALGIKDALSMGATDDTEGFKTLDQRAQAAGLQPQSPEYNDFMLNGGTQRQETAPVGYRFNAAGGMEFIPGGPADPKVGARNAVPTEGERKAGGMYERMEAAEQTIGKLVGEGASNLSLVESGLKNAGVPEGYALGAESQQVLQAQRDWVRAKLRLESGAVIGDEEMREEIKTYFPQPGEDPATVAQKKQSRQQAMEQVRTQGGRAVGEDKPRGAPAIGAVEEGHRYIGGPPDQPSSWEKVE